MQSSLSSLNHHHCLGKVSVEQFLSEYWQQKPLLIKNAFPDLISPVSADELAGLACEDHINSRLVLANLDLAHSNKQWMVEHGPLDESRFESLPESDWSLLVSDIERHVPEARELLKPFRFIPDWRIDDLMVSYAPEGGSVGPHTDEYDVFLIQLSGQRLWQISESFDTAVLEDTELCILKNFQPEQNLILNKGDMLYLPPNVAHYGIAQAYNNEDCMTASVGFRAPSTRTMISEYLHFLNERNENSSRYKDKHPQIPQHHAEINEKTIEHFKSYLLQGLSLDNESIRQWLGEYSSDNRAFEDLAHIMEPVTPLAGFSQLENLLQGKQLQQSPYSRFLFSRNADSASLFVDGHSYTTSKSFALLLCDEAEINIQEVSMLSNSEKQLLLKLYNKGSVTIND